MSPFIIRKDTRRKNKRNGRHSARKLSYCQSSAIKNKLNNQRGENNNNNITSRSINHSPNRFSILASVDDESSSSPLDINHHQTINTSPPLSSDSSAQLINNSSTSSISCLPDQRCTSIIADSSGSNDSLSIEAEINEFVEPLIDSVCMNAVMNARCIDSTGADFYEWAECDAFINHPSQLPSPPLPDSSPSSYTLLNCHLCSSEVFLCCPECSASLCYPHSNPDDYQLASNNSNLLAHTCAAFLQSVADDADRSQKEKNDDNENNAVQKSQSTAKNKKRKAKTKNKSSTNPLPSSPSPSTTIAPSPLPTSPHPSIDLSIPILHQSVTFPQSKVKILWFCVH